MGYLIIYIAGFVITSAIANAHWRKEFDENAFAWAGLIALVWPAYAIFYAVGFLGLAIIKIWHNLIREVK